MQPISLRALLVPTLLALPMFSACAATGQGGEHGADVKDSTTVAEAPPAKSAEAKKAAAKERKAAKKEHDLANARTELEIAELETAAKARKAGEELDEAKRDLDEARKSLEHFKTHDTPTQLADGRLDLDRAAERKVEAEQELHEMEATYQKDQFAKDTKELVLTRHRKQLEFATRSLELQQKSFDDLEREKLPRSQREMEKKLRDAEQKVRAAELEAKTTDLENKVKLAKAHFSVDDLQRPDDEEDDAKQGGKK
jgi:hypothetical protein